jgi:serine/threonine protein kinase
MSDDADYADDFDVDDADSSAVGGTAAAAAGDGDGAASDGAAAGASCGAPMIPFSELRMGRLRGGGAFACVYEAEWSRTGARVAVKTLADARADERAKAAFSAELRALEAAGAGAHAHIVRLVGACAHPRPAIVTELLGATVAEALARGPPRAGAGAGAGARWPLSAVLGWAAGLASAVAHLHARRPAPLLHRDIKAANVLLRGGAGAGGRAPEAVLCDFGLAGCREKQVGTPSHLAPELWAAAAAAEAPTAAPAPAPAPPAAAHAAAVAAAAAAPLARSADVYALGATLWSFFAGAEPWAGWAPADVRAAVAAGQRPDRSALRPDTPPAVVALIYAAMAQLEAARPGAGDIAAELERVRATAPAAAASTVAAMGGDALDDAVGLGVGRRAAGRGGAGAAAAAGR